MSSRRSSGLSAPLSDQPEVFAAAAAAATAAAAAAAAHESDAHAVIGLSAVEVLIQVGLVAVCKTKPDNRFLFK